MKHFLSMLILISISLATQAQNTVRGTVVDVNEEPVIGAAVMVVGTTTGTITDFDGNSRIFVDYRHLRNADICTCKFP